MTNVWKKLPKPFWILAPMEDVTDTVFRQIVASCGKPDLFFTEFTNADGIVKGGSKYIEQRLQYKKSERPLIAQIWGNNPNHYLESAKIIHKMGFDGIDINMGCPVRKVVKNGQCSGLIDNPNLARELYLAAVEGAGELPVSIKTRIGTKKIATDTWIPFLLDLKPAAITIHGRTAVEMSKVPCHWDEIGKAVKLRNQIKSETLIVGNGDILNRMQALQYVEEFGVDGVMIGRGIFQNPWIFNEKITLDSVSLEEKLKLLKKHITLFDKTWGKTKDFNIMKKFYKVYVSDINGAQEMRARLMHYYSAPETIQEISKIISSLNEFASPLQ